MTKHGEFTVEERTDSNHIEFESVAKGIYTIVLNDQEKFKDKLVNASEYRKKILSICFTINQLCNIIVYWSQKGYADSFTVCSKPIQYKAVETIQ